MASLGIGLGAFAQGFAGGVGLGQKWQESQRRNDDRAAIQSINDEGKAAFDADVAAGKTTPDKWNDHFSTNILPKLVQTHAQQGNHEAASFYQKWGDSDATRRGTAAFGRIMMANNFDDAGKAFADLGATKGYLPPGLVYLGSEPVVGPNGQQGMKVSWRAPDGKDYSQQFGSMDEMRRMASVAINPEAIGKMHVDQMGWAAEDKRKLGLLQRQRELEAQPGLQPAQPGFRWNADRSAQEPIPGGPAAPNYKASVAQAGQAPTVTEVYDPETGQPQKAIVNTATGEMKPIGGRKAPPVKRLVPAAIQNAEAEDLYGVQNIAGINGSLQKITNQLDAGSLQLGPVANFISGVRNAAGVSSTESANYASFRAVLEKLRNDSLRLNKGVQTEGDAVRAWDELIKNTNDPKVVKQRIAEITRLNNIAAEYRRNVIQQRRSDNNLEPLDIDRIVVPLPQDDGAGATSGKDEGRARTGVQGVQSGQGAQAAGQARALLDQARDAISKGADPAAVAQRLQKMGVDPRGLQ